MAAEVGFVAMQSSGLIGARLGTPEAATPALVAWRFLYRRPAPWRPSTPASRWMPSAMSWGESAQ